MNNQVSAAPKVAVVWDKSILAYPTDENAFSPSLAYPEYNGKISPTSNPIYALVRQLFRDLGWDAKNLDKETWNPLSEFIKPDQTVLIKPNWVLHHNKSNQGLACLVTHPSVLRAIIDYALLAKPRQIIVGDAPLQGCDLQRLWDEARYRSLINYYEAEGKPVRWVDFRRTILVESAVSPTKFENRRSLTEYVEFDLGKQSKLEPISSDWHRFRVTQYNPTLMLETHKPGVHKYLIAKEVLEADVVINVPKLKTHMKSGITAALKNLVGINGHKDFLPHHRKGGSAKGGDCYEGYSIWKDISERLLDVANRKAGISSRLVHLAAMGLSIPLKLQGADTKLEGAWYGNDTIWRTCLDLNLILLYGTLAGGLAGHKQRNTLHITDGIIAGEGEGPLANTPKATGLLTCTTNAVVADYVHAYLMGFDWRKIPIIQEAILNHQLLFNGDPQQIAVILNGQPTMQPWFFKLFSPFVPPTGWSQRCELNNNELEEPNYTPFADSVSSPI